ncbi:MAG: hypothetical protein HXY38_02050 [Chloroflexi bacterium]|nr:hypothetical protein [Chloroflexota bacterium]
MWKWKSSNATAGQGTGYRIIGACVYGQREDETLLGTREDREGNAGMIDLNAVITCPQCGFAKAEQMPPDT